ncbi:ketopantoate reductase family protein [Shinella sp. M31]|uniref:ketopantoate reductase family protein n=1 Tax=Shinella sp. M31 TaxID=3368615 RepID=UPI003B9DD1CD
MKKINQPRILIAGAGAMGLVSGYHLALSGAEVTFLVRPHRINQLARPQLLYSYDDGALNSYHGYGLATDLAQLTPNEYDYILITLDSAALRDPAGVTLAEAVGRIARNTSTRVILGTYGVELLPWFLSVSGLASDQVTNGVLGIQSHNVGSAELPLHAPTDADLLARADYAYRHCFPFGFIVDDSAPEVAAQFAALYSVSGVSLCIVMPAEQMKIFAAPAFAQLAAAGMGGWPQPADIDPESEFWRLGTASTLEILGLSIHGQAGQQAKAQTTATSILEFWRTWEQDMLPLGRTRL